MIDRFDRMLVHQCDILSNDHDPQDDYGEDVRDPKDWETVASDVPCWVDTNAIGRPHEEKVDPRISLNYRRIYMRAPVLSNGQALNPHHFIFAHGIYFNVFEVMAQYDLAGLHHLEVIAEEINTINVGEFGS